ncbi:MAG: rSAM-modified peptide [Candidatus Aminicenantes bacterium]|nr:rSAM-modified peptide [Candidatus Aminicenantes bacterium]NIM83647.1 rSAM-modified peptide [Candidatus Aminicenantes bacterium]NIN23071.1 rSAM-modified peptide [Candidatus Aminicenantes bacterium]NIN46798.1 rSAM-modified peptide [Candidatus Aminicenantes bacterium]NIN89720.1 rSAM-modified peptide [Candidatus Aminicenantes bacterium]
MKTKKFSEKLKLNKKTIAHLDNDEMNVVYGGIRTALCPSWIKSQCGCVTDEPTCDTYNCQ